MPTLQSISGSTVEIYLDGGLRGESGQTGPAGAGLRPGGDSGQILVKNSEVDYDYDWQDGVTIDTIDAQIEAQKGIPNGIADLDSDGKLPTAYIPGSVDQIIEAANLAAFPNPGSSSKIYVALDTGKTYRWGGSQYTEISSSPGSTDSVPEGATNKYFTNARAIAAAPVQSVAGRTGSVVVTKTDVGLSNVDNTADSAKPVSTATQTALNAKEPTIVAGSTAQYWRGDKAWQTLDQTAVGLSNVNNTSDINKPISTAMQNALDSLSDDAIAYAVAL